MEGKIIKGSERVLNSQMSIYTLANVMGARISQIDSGSPVYVNDDGIMDSFELALLEIKEKKSPISVLRKKNNEDYEEWSINELSIELKFITM